MEAQSVIAGANQQQVLLFSGVANYFIHDFLGRGPTRPISPFSTFSSCGQFVELIFGAKSALPV